ncbi:MAG TPA: DUF5655 domain-containing protein [Cyclobacteriaceae bacterium]
MAKKISIRENEMSLNDFLDGKSEVTLALFHHFVEEYKKIGKITLHPAKTMIGIATERKRVAYITQLGKNFIHVVFPFEKPHTDNLCFQKIAQVPGDEKQYNHHFRMLTREDVNKEVRKFMNLAYELGS